jgi:hypothetical protein
MKAYRRSKGIALTSITSWERNSVPVKQKAAWAQNRSGSY